MKFFATAGTRLSIQLGGIASIFAFALIALIGCPTLRSQTTFPGQIGVEAGDRPTGFIDAFKDQGRVFADSNGNPVRTDASGNPLSDGIAVIFDDRPTPEWLGYSDDPAVYQPECDGTYTMSFTGQAVLSNVAGNPVLTFSNQTYNAATNTTTVNVYLPGGPTFADGPALMVIGFTNTQLTPSSGTNTGIANLQVIRPGFTLAQAADPTQVFDPAFLSSLAPFGYIRFMNWLGTNQNPYIANTCASSAPACNTVNTPTIGWSQRSLPTDLYQGVGPSISSTYPSRQGAWGISWEYVILLANAANKDVWINVPINATGSPDPYDPSYVASPDTSSYIYNLAMLFKNGDAFTGNVGLKPGLHIYLEDSNEVWNFSFLQYGWNVNAAEAEVAAAPGGVSVLNNDGDSSQDDWAYRRHIKRVYEIAQIFESVYGSGSFGSVIRPVYAWWQLDEGAGSNAANALAWFKTNYGPPANYFYALAQADYFNAPNYANDTTIPEVLADMSAASTASVPYVTAAKATANQYGLQLVSYEGGPASDNGGTQSTTNVGVQILANRDPGMNTLVQTHIRNNWFGNGGNMFGYFALSGAYSRYGDWGATDDYRNLTTAKYNALVNLAGYENNGVPVAPGDLVATAGNSAVALSWEPVPGAANYNVMRGATSGGETQIATVSSSTYSDSTVSNGTTYYYEVTAMNSTGTSAPSNEASATPESSAPPAPVLSATAGNGQVTLTWSTAAGATSYNVYEGTTAGGESSTPIATGVTLTSYTVTGLANGTTYYFEIAGVNVIGTGAVSNEAPATPVGPPAPPTGLTATIGNAQAVLNWTAVTGATSYNVYEGATSGGENSTPIATGIAAATYTVTGLTNGTAYFFTVASVNAAGVSGYSNEASVTPAPPSALLAYEPFGEAAGYLNGASGGGDSGWGAAWSVQNSKEDTPGYDIASASPLTYTGLLTTGQYATGGDGYVGSGRQLNVSSGGPFASYLSSGLIGAPGQTIWLSFLMSVNASNIDSTSITLTAQNVPWYVSPANVGVGYFGSGYWGLEYNSGAPVLTNVPMTLNQPALLVMSVTFGATNVVNLYVNPASLGGAAPATPSATYSTASTLAFQSLCWYAGHSPNMSSLADIRVGATYAAVTPAAAAAPPAPTGLTATAGNGQATLNWTASTGATSYNVYEGTAPGGESSTPIATGIASPTYTATGLANGTAYYFTVAAVNASGTSAASNEASATPAPPAPAPPTNLAAAAGNGQVVLTWTASTGAASYNVYQGAASGGESSTPVATGIAALTYTVTGLTNGTPYFFTVAAVNAGGVSGPSNEATATPAAPSSGTLLAYEPFGEAGTPPFALNGVSGGGDSGWGYAWSVQNGNVTVPGYNVASASPLTYTGLVTTPDYAVGGSNYVGSGRQLDVTATGPFASYLSSGLIGASGQTIWISALMRKDISNSQPIWLNLDAQSNTNAWNVSPDNVGMGYFGGSGTHYWGLAYNTSSGTPVTTVVSTVPVVVGTPALLVMSVTFGATNVVNLYVNPASLGGAAPATPSATYSTTSSLAFESLAFYGGSGSGMSSIGNIRVGTSFAAVTPAVPVAPPAPTGLAATAGNGQATLNWTASTGATSYNVYEGTAPGGESSTPIATGIASPTYTATGLANGTAYYFTVAAVNASGTSAASNEASATPAPPAPAPPTNLTAAAGNGQVVLTWTASTGAASYNVYQGAASGGESSTPIATGITGVTYTVTGLSNGTPYFFTVAAVNAGGVSGPSNEATATPAAPSNGTLLAYEPFGEAGTPPFALNGVSGGGDSGWGYAWSVQNGNVTVPGYNVASASPLTYTGLVTTPDYAVGGSNYVGAGRQLNVTTTGPFASYLSSGLIGASGQTIWISALMRKDISNSQPIWLNLDAQSNTNAWNVSPDNVGMGYFGASGTHYWSLAYNASSGTPVTTVASTVPVVVGTPALLVMSVTFGATNTVNLYVNPASLGGAAPATPSATYSTASSLAFESLAFYGGNGSGMSSIGDIRVGSSFAAVTPAASAAPPAPTGLAATAGNGQATLNWTASTGATSYNVYEGTTPGGESSTPIATGIASPTYTATGLANGTAYYFTVTAVNASGTSAASNEASATPAPPAPAPPTNLTAAAGDGQAVLTWTASMGATSYNVYQGAAPGGESSTPIATGIAAATYTVTGLANGTPYFFTVAAVNAGGVSGPSNEATATPAGSGTLLAYEPFGEATGVLYGANGGGDFGWNAAWVNQSGSADPIPGYNIVSTTPLVYTGLVENGNYLIGGEGYNYAGRELNIGATGPFASYLSNGMIGAPGQTLWFSFLLRKDTSSTGTSNLVSLDPSSGGLAWYISSPSVGAGFCGGDFGGGSTTGSTMYWSLIATANFSCSSAIQTNVPIVVGQPALLVMSVTFGATNTVNLYVNPASLDGAAPATPSATYSTTNGLAFDSLSYYGGDGANQSSLDEIRVGTSFAAVTPAVPVVIPPSPSSLTATPGNGLVTLSWTPVTGATSYNVYQGTASGGESATPVATGVTAGNYTVTGLTNGTAYYFEVAAVNAAGTGAFSSEASATPSVAAGIPAAPVLSAAGGDQIVTLSWPAVPGASTYNVYQATTSGGEGTTPIVTGVTATTYTVSGLTDETTYFFQVSATNSSGTSALSNQASATPAPPVGGTNAPAVFSIYPQVVAANPIPVGFNMQPAAGTDITENAWLADGGFNTLDARMSFTASQNGTATTFIATGAGGTSFYDSIATGYFVGATAYTYRYSSGAWSLLRTDTVSSYTAADDSTPADNTITFANSGPQILAGDITWLELDNQPTVPGVTLLDPRFTVYCPNWMSETASCDTRTSTLPYTLSTDVPSSDTGGLSLEFTDANTETNGIRQYIQGAFVGPADEEFQPGHTYKVDVWLKQSGSNGNVTFFIDNIGVSHTFTGVTDAWQEFTWTFPAVTGLAANSAQPAAHLDFSAPGTMWVDNFQLYDAAWPPNTVSPQVMQAWQNYQPGTVRIWSDFGNASQNYSYLSLDSWLTPEIKTRNTPGIGNQYEVPAELEHLPDALANVKAIGTANPWLIVNMALSPTEWGELIDYLAAPAGTGYASMRPASHPGPYTADFSTIYLEVGNEEWGTQQVPADAAYGQWAHYVISSAIAGKSYFDSSKIKFIANGFELEPSFGSAAIAAAPEVSYTEAALYTSGNSSLSGDPYYQSDLVQVPVTNAAYINATVAQQQLDAASGRVYGLAAYEEGSGSNTGDNTLAAAVGAIDTSLYASQSGFGPQNLFQYQLGTGPWSTHSNFANGFIPHPIWEAYQMRNNYCSGPIVLTTTNSDPTYSDPTITNGKAVPLIAVYTFQDAHIANQADVVVISRDLNNQTPVTLNFPATPTGAANLYTLTGDPRATNTSALNIPIGSTEVSITSTSYTFTMPPGSMYIFQVPMSGTWSSTGVPTPPPPASLSASAGNGEVTLTWVASEGATGYHVLRGAATGGPYTQIGTSTSVAYTDTAVTNGTTYYYVVEATNLGGASANSPEASATPNVEDDTETNTPPPLDGSDTGAWANVPFVPLTHYFSPATGTAGSPDTAAYKTLWDSNYLYVLVSVQDQYLIAPSQADIYDGETVELYFSGTDTRSTTYGPTDFQYAFPYGNGGAVVTETYHSPASLTGVLFGQQNIAGGYQMVMALPWTTLGTVPVLNQQYGLDLMVDTATSQGTRVGKLGWWATCDCDWDNPSNMGPLVLTQPAIQSQAISFTPPASPVAYGAGPIALSATGGASGNPVTFSVLSGPGTVSGNSLTITGVGTVVVAAYQAGNSSYSAAPEVTESIVVNQASQTIAFTPPTSPVTYGVGPIALAATGGDSGDAVNFSVLSGPGTVSGNLLTITGVGTVVVAADQAGNTDYSAATEVTESIVINQASQTIAFTPPTSPVTYGVGPITLAATGGSSGNPVTFSIVSGPGTVSGSMLFIKGAGTVVVAANQAGNADYSAAPQAIQSVAVNQANLTVTANSITEPFGTTPVLTAAITGFVNGDGLSAVSGAPALSTTATAASLPGSYPISIGQGTLSAANYSFTLIGGTVTVTFTATAPSKGTLCNGAYSGTFNGNLTVTAGQTCVFVGGAVTGNIQQSGGTVEIIQSTVDGNLQVTGGGIFTVTSGSTVKGNLQIQSIPAGPATNLVCGSSVGGNLVYQNNGTAVLIGAAAPASCPGNVIGGDLTIQSNSAPASATGNTVKGNLTVQSNTAAAGAVDNTVKGNLTVQSNTADTVVDGNTVSGNLQDQSNTAATQVFTNIVGANLQCQSNTTITGGGNTAKSKQGQCSAF